MVLFVNVTPQPLYPRAWSGIRCIGGWLDPRAGLDMCEKCGPQVVLGYVTLFYISILQLTSSGFKLNKFQVLLPEDGGRLLKHAGGKTVCLIYVRCECCSHFVCNYTVHYITQYPLIQLEFNPSKTKRRLLYLKTQSVPRCKHFLSRLQKPFILCCKWHKLPFVIR
jgi:hypothetical protein